MTVRRLGVGWAFLVVLVVLALALTPLPGGAATAPVTTKIFDGSFQPDQIVSADGAIWMIGSGPDRGDAGRGCRVGRLDPRTMRVTTYRMQACGFNVTAGDGAVFLETTVAEPADNAYAIHIERFSTATHRATVFPTVSTRVFLGSDIAHTQLAFVEGALWFYGTPDAGAGPEVLRLSPGDGAVERSYPTVPEIGGTEPLIAATPGSVWLAGGAGSGADFARIALSGGPPDPLRLDGPFVSVYDLVSVAGRLYFLYLASQPGSTERYSSHVGALGANDSLVTSPDESVGSSLLSLGGRPYAIGPGASCASGIHAWSVTPGTLRTLRIANLAVPDGNNPCLNDDDFRPAAAAGGALFYLFTTPAEAVLYRVRVP